MRPSTVQKALLAQVKEMGGEIDALYVQIQNITTKWETMKKIRDGIMKEIQRLDQERIKPKSESHAKHR